MARGSSRWSSKRWVCLHQAFPRGVALSSVGLCKLRVYSAVGAKGGAGQFPLFVKECGPAYVPLRRTAAVPSLLTRPKGGKGSGGRLKLIT